MFCMEVSTMEDRLIRQLLNLGLQAVRVRVYRQREAAHNRAILRAVKTLNGAERDREIEFLSKGLMDGPSVEELVAQELHRMESGAVKEQFVDPMVDNLLRRSGMATK